MSTETDSALTCALSTDDDSADLDSALAALRSLERPAAPRRSPRSSHRAALGLVLCGLLVGGIFAVGTAGRESRSDSAGAAVADDVYLSAHPGSCLAWQPDRPDRPSFIQCATPHLFEVASAASNTNEPCALTVRTYLGNRFDPNSKFSVAELSPSDRSPAGTRKRLCGLELTGPDGHPVPFRGQVAESDQSKVWPPGTCRGIDEKTAQPTDAVVDCAGPHSVEVVGAVDLGRHFHDDVPSDSDQLVALEDSCNELASAYLAPRTVASTGLSVIYHAIGPTSWTAGSRQAVCALGPNPSGPITGPATSHHAVVEAPVQWTPQPETAPTQNAISNASQNASPAPAGGQDSIVQVPAGPGGDAHSIVSIPGLAPITVPAMPEDPGAGPVPFSP